MVLYSVGYFCMKVIGTKIIVKMTSFLMVSGHLTPQIFNPRTFHTRTFNPEDI